MQISRPSPRFLGIGTDYLKKVKYLKIQLKRTSLFKILSAFLLVLILTWRKRKEMREDGSYNFCDRDCARYFTLTISLNLCNIIIHFIDVETAAQKGLFTCQ